jgi:hypothetical protein
MVVEVDTESDVVVERHAPVVPATANPNRRLPPPAANGLSEPAEPTAPLRS